MLPLLFRDAIVLTRALGIKYILIDAICILQDDAADMSTQLSQMAQIYHEAIIEISADSATSANDRLFMERPNSSYLRTKSIGRSMKGSEVLLDKGIDYGILGSRKMADKSWPLATRGWTLQERFLAIRIVHVSAAENAWEYNDELRCECKFIDQSERK
jgi:hypothetical protein